ncbi:type II secretion system protein GspM [Noviherbaspirillum denitrificans]|uniref:General secretion pathway protein GspM n=1 Tax=Noviherbaspirillum denitrificans TaxID=1968433 RepID=A0A254T8A9_9BURK|nr:type II secretion system protein M [Noviherbaspirillum denitrificans]OWW18890.1 general secretion pathway protein GspM [Noviherbaspirillum denitrificans]
MARTSGMKQFWSERNKREQNMLALAAVVILFGLLYALLIDPAISGRADLEKKLPNLRQQAAEVQALSKEASALGSKTPAAAPPAMTRESIEASLARKGLKAQGVTVSGELAKLQLNGVPFSALAEWLADAQKTARMSVLEAMVETQQQPDTVNANLTLRQQRGE